MRRILASTIVVLGLVGIATTGHAQLGLRAGGGIHYLRTVGDIKNDPAFDKNAYNLVASAQLDLGFIRAEGDLEWVPDYGGSGKSLLQPQAYALIGRFLYGGVGIGWGHFDGQWFDQPFYALRAGVDFPFGPIHVDANANYRFLNTKVLDSIDTEDLDSITFGVIARLDL
jgi:hypothetical protein